MATYGIQCFDASGNILLDTTDRISRVVWSAVKGPTESGTVVVPEIEFLDTIELSLALDTGYPLSILRSGTDITYAPQDLPPALGLDCVETQLLVLAYT